MMCPYFDFFWWYQNQNKFSVILICSIILYLSVAMASSSPTQQQNGATSINNREIKIPLHNILKHLALQHSHGETLFPTTWTSLRLRGPVQTEIQALPSSNAPYHLQHNAHAIYDRQQKKWRIQGDNQTTALKILGIIVSKQHGARAIQLPNHTHKIVSGIINAQKLLPAFSEPAFTSNNKKVILTPIQGVLIPFVPIAPQHASYRSSSSGAKNSYDITYDHLEYALHSGKRSANSAQKGIQRQNNLSWQKSSHSKISLENGSDITDLARYKGILASLRSGLLEDQTVEVSGSRREVLEKRLILLEHQIDGLLKRKIQYTSKDHQNGTRFLDYTVILNQKENQIISLHKKIDNLTVRLNNSQKLFKGHYDDLKLKGVKIENQDALKGIFSGNKDLDSKIAQGIVHVVQAKDRIIEVPVHDEKNSQLIKQMGLEIQRIYSRYPKIKDQADPHFIQILNKQVLHIVDADGLSKIVQIVKFVPSVVKVENVYNYNTDSQRKLQFHLKVLLKSLLLQFEKLKSKTGVIPQIDESVITMIHRQIGDVEVDDILKTFQVNHKIVEVPKIVQKVVDRVVEVPTVLPVEKIVEKIVQNTKIQQVEKIIHVPIEIIKYVDRIIQKIVQVQKIKQKVVQVPRIVEKIVEKRVQVPKIIEVEVIKQKIVEVEKPITVQKIVNQVVPQIRQVYLNKQETVVVKQIEEKIKQVERIVEKIVERVVQKPVIVQVQRIVEKLVNTIQYKPARQVVNHIQQIPQIVQRVVQKVIPIIQTVQKIKEVTKIVQKIVQVRVEVPTVKQVKVIEQKIVYVDRIKQIEKIVEKVVPLIHQQLKVVQKRIQVPVIQEKIVKVTEIMEKVIPEKVETVKIVEVQKIVQRLVEVPKIMEVIKTVVKYITVEKPVKVLVETIVEVPKIIEKIKEVRVPVDKIIQKLVEVPKVVEVEKIVQKIVVVPRIVEKIVEVPRIVQKIVDRIVEIQKIKEVVRQVKVPIIQQKVVEVEVIKHIQVPVYKTIQIIKEKIVPAISTKEVIKEVNVVKEKIVENRVQIPKDILIDKIVSHTVELQKIVEVEKALVIPFEVPVPCDKVIEKLVVIEKEVEKPVQVKVTVQKLVQVIKEVATVKQLTRVQQKIVTSQKIKEVQKIVPYITEKVTGVEIIKEKPVLTTKIQERIKQVPAIHEKIVQVIHQVPKIYQVQKVIEKSVEVPKFIEITSKQPIFITNNKIVEKFIDKIVAVHTVEQEIVSVPTIQEKIVTIQKLVQQIKQVQVSKDKIVEKDKLIHKTDVNNQIETKYKTVDRIEEKLVPINSSSEKLVEVPHIMEKIVERIVLMPQVHQVTKHIYDIRQEANPGIAVDVDFQQHKAKYLKLYSHLKKDTDGLVGELKLMQRSHPQLTEKINSIIAYINNLDEVIAYPRIVQVSKDKVVHKEVPVPVVFNGKRNPENIKTESFYLVLIEKLVDQLKAARQKSSYVIHDEQLNFLFLNPVNKQDDKKIREKIAFYTKTDQGRKYGQDTLLNAALYDKYHYANLLEKSKLETDRQRRISDERLSLLHQYKQTNDKLHHKLLNLEQKLRQLSKQSYSKQCLQQLKRLSIEIESLDQLIYSDIKNAKITQPLHQTVKIHGTDVIYKLQQTEIRELKAEIQLLKKEYVRKQGSKINQNALADKERVINSLTKTITHLMEKGTKTTLGDRDADNVNNITSIDHIDGREHQPLSQITRNYPNHSRETSILNKGAYTPRKEGNWVEYPIVQQGNDGEFGYIVLPERAFERSKGYKLIKNKHQNNYTLIIIEDNEVIQPNTYAETKIVPSSPTKTEIIVPSSNQTVVTKNITTIIPSSVNQTDIQRPSQNQTAVVPAPSNQTIVTPIRNQQISPSYSQNTHTVQIIPGNNNNETWTNPKNVPRQGIAVAQTTYQPISQGSTPINNQARTPQAPINYDRSVIDPKNIPAPNISNTQIYGLPNQNVHSNYNQNIGNVVTEPYYQAVVPNLNNISNNASSNATIRNITTPTKNVQTSNQHVDNRSVNSNGSFYQPVVPNATVPHTSIQTNVVPYQYSNVPNQSSQTHLVDHRTVVTDRGHQTVFITDNRGHGEVPHYIIEEEHVTAYPFGNNNWLAFPNSNISQHPGVIGGDPAPLSRSRVLHFTYQQPGAMVSIPTVVPTIPGPLIIDPSHILNLPGQNSKVVYTDPQTGAKIEEYNQAGLLGAQGDDGATYTTNYLYKSEVKETGEGVNKIETKITEIRTNQTVNWISRSRAIDNEGRNSPQKQSNSPIKDIDDDRRSPSK